MVEWELGLGYIDIEEVANVHEERLMKSDVLTLKVKGNRRKGKNMKTG